TPGKYRIDNAKLVKGEVSGTGKDFQTYQITPIGDLTKSVKLEDHVGHKVELTGSVVEGSSSDPPRFFATEFKMVAKGCPSSSRAARDATAEVMRSRRLSVRSQRSRRFGDRCRAPHVDEMTAHVVNGRRGMRLNGFAM